jgi:hypothetical protein
MSLAAARKAVQFLKQEAEERRHAAPLEIKDLSGVFEVFEQDMKPETFLPLTAHRSNKLGMHSRQDGNPRNSKNSGQQP